MEPGDLVVKRILLLGAIALVTGVAVRVVTAPAPAVAIEGPGEQEALKAETGGVGDGRPRWQEVWTRPAPNAVAVSLAPNGTSVAWVDGRGSVRRVAAETGKTLWQTSPLPGVNALLVAPEGQVLAYSRLNPVKPVVRVLNPKWGEAHGAAFPVEGAVWRAALAAGGRRAIVGTGRSLLYLIPLQVNNEPNKPQPMSRRLPVQGIPASVATAADETVALMGTYQDTGVGVWGMDGLPRWRHDEREEDRTYDVQLSGDGRTAVAVSARGPRRTDARLHVWDAVTGRLLWIEHLEAFDPKVRVSANGQFIAVSYARTSSYNTGATLERKVALFGIDGRRLFADKGGLFFSPDLVALSAGGERITVRDNSGTLWTLNNTGRTVSRMRLPLDAKTGKPPSVIDALATDDGAYLLLRRGDDKITFYKAAS